jgi:hypothetical protein
MDIKAYNRITGIVIQYRIRLNLSVWSVLGNGLDIRLGGVETYLEGVLREEFSTL